MRRWRSIGAIVAVAVVAGTVGAGGSVWASHQFSDVGDGNQFHDEIGAIADSCITQGFGDGTFRPGNSVNRQAMAAFLERGLSHVEVAEGADATLPGDNAGEIAGPQTLTTVDVDIPSLPGCEGQYVELIGRATGDLPGTYVTRCLAIRCTFWLQLYEGGDLLGQVEGVLTDFEAKPMTVTAVVPAGPGTHTYTLVASTWLLKEPPDGGGVHDIMLIAETHPFSATAG